MSSAAISTVTAIVRDGKLVAGERHTRPVPWWSFGKTVLAAAALALVRDGRLALDAPLSAPSTPCAPWASGDHPSYTLRQLLCHTAGVPNYSDLGDYAQAVGRQDAPWSPEEILARAQSQPPLFMPGQGWAYSNTGYLLVRRIIEAASGSNLEQALTQLVFAPLDIHGVALADTPADLLDSEWGNPGGYHPRWVYHGLLTGTPAAAALLLDRLLSAPLLPPPLLADMLCARTLGQTLPGRPAINFGYAAGLMMAQDGPAGRSIGHTGAGPMSVAAVYRFPDRGCTVASFAPVTDQAVVEWLAHQAAKTGGTSSMDPSIR